MSLETSLTSQYPSLDLILRDVASQNFMAIADATIYGTPGHMRYGHMKAKEKIKTLKYSSFVELKRGDKTIGIVALVGHQVNVGDTQVTGKYVRYFTIHAPMRSGGSKTSDRKERNGLIHQMIKEQFDDPEQMFVEPIDGPSIIYAYVESLNVRSLNMVRSLGFMQSRALVTLIFSRFYPKEKLEVSLLSEDRISEMEGLVRTFYKDYNLVTEFEDWENYFVHEVGGQVVLGVKLETNTWTIHEMPGFDGWLFRKVLPKIPILKRIFQGSKIDFIGIERLYVKQGFEYLLPDFLETLCARFDVTKALIGVDNQSPLHTLLKSHGKLGILDKLINPSPGLLFSRAYDLSVEDNQTLHDRPFYVSTYDMS